MWPLRFIKCSSAVPHPWCHSWNSPLDPHRKLFEGRTRTSPTCIIALLRLVGSFVFLHCTHGKQIPWRSSVGHWQLWGTLPLWDGAFLLRFPGGRRLPVVFRKYSIHFSEAGLSGHNYNSVPLSVDLSVSRLISTFLCDMPNGGSCLYVTKMQRPWTEFSLNVLYEIHEMIKIQHALLQKFFL